MATEKTIGPTIPSWQLGRNLQRLREKRGLAVKDVAAECDLSVAKIYRIEQSRVGVTQNDLNRFVDLYDVDESTAESLERLRKLGKQKGWWAKYTRDLKIDQGILFDIEDAAIAIRTWEPYVIPGLLQTERYARALISQWPLSTAEIDTFVTFRLERQKHVWEGGDTPNFRAIIDESVLLRPYGDHGALREQLERLLDPPESCTVQVLPFNACHTGNSGAVTVYEFEPDLHTPILYAETYAGGIYFEDEKVEDGRYLLDGLIAAAHDLVTSRKLIRATMNAID